MRIASIAFDDDERPHTICVAMNIAEAAIIARVFGKMNGYAHRRLGTGADTIYSSLATMFAHYWDDGTASFGPDIDLAGVNDPVQP